MSSNLAAALAAFQAEMPSVPKTKTANAGSYSYKYADLADVSAAAMPLLTAHGLAFSCGARVTEQGGYELVGYLLHSSGEKVEGALPIQGRSAQELGSSITYMRRYLFGMLTGIVTDDDDDGRAASQPAKKATTKKPAEKPTDMLDPSSPLAKRMHAAFHDKGIDDRADRLHFATATLGREVASSNELTVEDARKICTALESS